MARRTTVFLCLYSYHRHRHHYQHYQQYHHYRFYHRRFYHHRFYHHRFHHHRFKHHRLHHQCFTHHRRRHHRRHHHYHHCVYHECFYHVFLCIICFAFIFTFVIHHLLFTIISSSSNNIMFIIFYLFVRSFDRSIIPSSSHPFIDWTTYPFSESSSPSSLSYGIIIIIVFTIIIIISSSTIMIVLALVLMVSTICLPHHNNDKYCIHHLPRQQQAQQQEHEEQVASATSTMTFQNSTSHFAENGELTVGREHAQLPIRRGMRSGKLIVDPCRSTPVFKTVFAKRLFYSANDRFPYPAASTPAIFFKNVCYVQLWPRFGSVRAASTCPRGSCLYFMRNWLQNENSAVNGAWIRVKAEWKEVLSRERRF